jgi:hypothetical protein
MDYQRVYQEFIANRRAKAASLLVFEEHHIQPKYLKGSDEPGNLVRLSLQDHLFAHLLLGRIYGGHLAQCYIRMSGMKKYKTGRRVRINFEAMRLRARVKIGEGLRATWADPGSVYNSPDTRERRSAGQRGNQKRRGAKNTPEMNEAVKKAQRARAASGETAAEKKAHWAAEDSPYRTEQYTRRQSAAQLGSTHNSENMGGPKSISHKQAMASAWNRPGYREMMRTKRQAYARSPEGSAQLAAARAARQQNSPSGDSASAGAL